MYKLKEIADKVYYVGVNDRQKALFENMWPLPYGVSYNSYLIVDEKTVLIDTVDVCYSDIFLKKIADALDGRTLDYLVVNHMEPDHAGSIRLLRQQYPDVQIIGNKQTFGMLDGYHNITTGLYEVKEGDTLNIGRHQLSFYMAPMVHWPEVMVTYDSTDKLLFSADAFGTYGTLDGGVIDEEMNVDHYWEEMIRYYSNIVGKYGAQVQALLKKAVTLDIEKICPLHGPILTENLGYYLDLYQTWSSYGVETEGVMIAYASVYGNTKKAAELLGEELKANGCPRVVVADLAREDMAECIEDAFRHGKLVLATITYNGGVFPFMQTFIDGLKERNFQNRTIGIIENGSWAPVAAKNIKSMMEGCKNLTWTETSVTIKSGVKEETKAQIKALADELWSK